MAMAMSIYRTLCVLVFLFKISLLEIFIAAFGNENDFFIFGPFIMFSPSNFTPKDTHCCFWQ